MLQEGHEVGPLYFHFVEKPSGDGAFWQHTFQTPVEFPSDYFRQALEAFGKVDQALLHQFHSSQLEVVQ